ncbi:PREDICTED: uncharacterized protein LOC107070875 [Polistes dominula]|uniref:Uncharacterized protein LOC107070875 n=1 Tax=Polistes dominula TaxID=743375 RepID=A0ABM1IXG9_POLDO|nr:PREDICTED: uncharacterized protein LOC107070875 [Polistes dominula]
MMGHAAASKEILFFFLVTCIYMTYGILMKNPTKLPSIVHSYLPPPRSVPVSMSTSSSSSSSSNIVYANHKYDVVDEPEEIADKRRGHHLLETSYLYPDSRPITVSLPFKDEIVQTFDKADKINSLNRNRNRESFETSRNEKLFEITTKNTNPLEQRRHLIPISSQYKVKEVSEKEADDDEEEEEEEEEEENSSIGQQKSYHGKNVDQLTKLTLNGDSYNNDLHPPTNPVLALILSRYGKYVSGLRNPRLYSYMAVNNIHNNRPFGQYKQECEEEPR